MDGRKVIQFSNGTKKEILPDGHSIVYFTNGDIKKVTIMTNIYSFGLLLLLL